MLPEALLPEDTEELRQMVTTRARLEQQLAAAQEALVRHHGVEEYLINRVKTAYHLTDSDQLILDTGVIIRADSKNGKLAPASSLVAEK